MAGILQILKRLNVPESFIPKLTIAWCGGAERGWWWDTPGCPVDEIPAGDAAAAHREEGLRVCIEVVRAKSKIRFCQINMLICWQSPGPLQYGREARSELPLAAGLVLLGWVRWFSSMDAQR